MLVTICIPSIKSRREVLTERAVPSVEAQEVQPGVEVRPVVEVDPDRSGAWVTRNAAVRSALELGPDWVGFLDDDDELLSHHVDHLLNVAAEHDAAMVWGWYRIIRLGELTEIGEYDPCPARGVQYDRNCPHAVPITFLVRADVLAEAMELSGGFQSDLPDWGSWDFQDLPVVNAIYDVSGGALRADPRVTWYWHHHGDNTSGLPTRGQ